MSRLSFAPGRGYGCALGSNYRDENMLGLFKGKQSSDATPAPNDALTMEALFPETLCGRLAPRLPAIAEAANRQARVVSVSADATSGEDCLFLYMLVRRFGLLHPFEIGTSVGSSAVAINAAARENGGVFTTCDPVDYGAISPWSGIRFMKMPAQLALYILRNEPDVRPPDLCFVDFNLDDATLAEMKKTIATDALIAVHDYFPDGTGNNKGATVVGYLNKNYCVDRPGRWLLPSGTPWPVPGSTLSVNMCTALFVPHERPL